LLLADYGRHDLYAGLIGSNLTDSLSAVIGINCLAMDFTVYAKGFFFH